MGAGRCPLILTHTDGFDSVPGSSVTRVAGRPPGAATGRYQMRPVWHLVDTDFEFEFDLSVVGFLEHAALPYETRRAQNFAPQERTGSFDN